MSRNGAGVYSLPAGNPVTTGTAISSTVQNNTTADIATALTASIAYDGQTTPIANLPMGGYKHTNVANASNATDYAAYGQVLPLTGGTVTGATTFSSTLAVTGAATLSSALTVTGNETVGGTLGVTGASTLASLAVTGNETVGGTLGVTGLSTLASLAVTGAAAFSAGPTAPTAAVSTNTTQLATTAFVIAQRKLGPAFSGYNSSSQSLVSNTDSKIALGSEDFDSDSTFASSRFTPTVAGYYQINWMVNISGSSITECYAAIYKNGAEYVRGGQLNIGSGAGVSVFGSTGAQVIFFNGSTDYVELWQHSFGSSLSATLSKFSGAYFRAS